MFTKETWEFINSFAPWLSALGTLLAVIVSLYLATREKRIRLQVNAGYRLLIGQAVQNSYPELLYISVLNKGYREAQVTNIGWKVGFIKKQHIIQTIILNDGMSSTLPIKLKDGEIAKYYIPINEETNWINNFIENVLLPNPKRQIRHLKVQAFTSVGKVFESRIDKSLKERILKDIKK